jgi:hypothetical protein
MARRRVFTLLVFVLGCMQAGASAAQPEWRFVSSTGSNGGPCSRHAPCRSIARAVELAPAGGTVVVLDSGVHEPFVIDKALTVTAAPGAHVEVRVTAGIGILAFPQPSEVVVLRGLSVRGVGGEDGAEFWSGTAHVEDCEMSGFTRNGFAYRGGRQLFVKDTIVRDNSFGIHVNGPGARASLDRVRFENTGEGLSVWSGIVSVRDSVMSGNHTGIQSGSADGYAEINVTSCLVTNNDRGVRALPLGGQGSLLRIAGSTVTNNTSGLLQGGLGVLLSRGDNTVEGNVTDLVGTIGTYSPK